MTLAGATLHPDAALCEIERQFVGEGVYGAFARDISVRTSFHGRGAFRDDISDAATRFARRASK